VSRRVSGNGAAARGQATSFEGNSYFQLDKIWARQYEHEFLERQLFVGAFQWLFFTCTSNGSIQGQIVPIPRLSPAVVTPPSPEIALWEHFLNLSRYPSAHSHPPNFTMFRARQILDQFLSNPLT
jgi:hypothetical protein